MNNNNKIKTNIFIYIFGVLILSVIGGVLIDNGYEVGALILVIGPVLLMVLLRYFAGDGFKDAGLSFKLNKSWAWYLFSLFIPPIIIFVVIILGMMFGVTSLNNDLSIFISALFLGMAMQFIPRFVLAICEEWGWRGYLEPRLVKLGVPDLPRHLFVGFIWAIWHFPLILSTSYTEISYVIFLPFFVVGLMISAIVYGQVLKASGTVWTSVLMHGAANATIWAIIQNDLIHFNNKLLAYPAPESVFMIILTGGIGYYLYSKLHKNYSISSKR